MSNGQGKTLYKCFSEGKGGEEEVISEKKRNLSIPLGEEGGGINDAIDQSINQSINTYARISDYNYYSIYPLTPKPSSVFSIVIIYSYLLIKTKQKTQSRIQFGC